MEIPVSEAHSATKTLITVLSGTGTQDRTAKAKLLSVLQVLEARVGELFWLRLDGRWLRFLGICSASEGPTIFLSWVLSVLRSRERTQD